MRFLILGVVFLSISCSSDFLVEENPLSGTWLEIGSRISAGGPLPLNFEEVANGNTFIFKDDGTFSLLSDSGNVINSGSYTNQNEELLLVSNQNGSAEPQRFNLELSSNTMVLSPTGPVICIEGCFFRYQRINN